jgi:hypothetical protein
MVEMRALLKVLSWVAVWDRNLVVALVMQLERESVIKLVAEWVVPKGRMLVKTLVV